MRGTEDSETRRAFGDYGNQIFHDCLCAQDIIRIACDEGYITCKVRDIALARTQTVMNGDWMLEHPVVGNGRYFTR